MTEREQNFELDMDTVAVMDITVSLDHTNYDATLNVYDFQGGEKLLAVTDYNIPDLSTVEVNISKTAFDNIFIHGRRRLYYRVILDDETDSDTFVTTTGTITLHE